MRVVVAGATGAIGRPVVSRLLAAGHEVVALARSTLSLQVLEEAGAITASADVLDAAAVRAVIMRTRPDVVVNQLTSLPQRPTAEAMRAAADADRRVKVQGGANLEEAAKQAGVRRYILQSSAFFYAPGDGLADESEAFAVGAPSQRVAGGAGTYSRIEEHAQAYGDWDVIILRYGFFYGPGTWYTRDGEIADRVRRRQYPVAAGGVGVWSFVHVDDAASSVIAALSAERGAYNVVDDDPTELCAWLPAFARWIGAPPPPEATAEETLAGPGPDALYYATKLRGASNAKARLELGFRPRRLEWLE